MDSWLVFRRNTEILNQWTKRHDRSFTWFSKPFFRMVSSHQTRDLECFADRSSIPENLPTIFHSDLIATILQKCLLSLCALLFQQSHLFPICVVSTYNDSRKDLHKLCQIPRNCQCKWLLVSSRVPGTFASSFVFPEKFFVLHGYDWIHWVAKSCTTTAYRWLFRDSQPSLNNVWSAVIKSPKFPARSSTLPKRILHGALVILVLLQIWQCRSLGKWVSTLCLPKFTLPAGSKDNSWEELACESLCSGTLPSTRFSLNSCNHSGMSE